MNDKITQTCRLGNDIFEELSYIRKKIEELREANRKRALEEIHERKNNGHIYNR